MSFDLWSLYALMFKSRLFEEAVAVLWREGLISGEMHLGTGEEAIVAGVISQLREGDGMALDHRGSAALLMRGVEPLPILLELLGHRDGLCGGRGGHMHLFSQEHTAASSGIVGSSGPTGAGFALAAQYLRPGALAVAFFGEGAMNQGMLLETLNLASVWNLPLVFVCKDDGWSITTQSEAMTGGDLIERAEGFGIPALDVDGREVSDVWHAAREAVGRARSGQGPTFLRGRCVHLEGHFLGMQLLRAVQHPLRELPGIAKPLARSFLSRKGARPGRRIQGLRTVVEASLATLRDPRRDSNNDPVLRARRNLLRDSARLQKLEERIQREISEVVAAAVSEVST